MTTETSPFRTPAAGNRLTCTPAGARSIAIDGTEHGVRVSGPEFATMAEAEAFAGMFPKGAQMRAHQVYSSGGNFFTCESRFRTASDKVIGDKNEAGIRRYRQIIKAAEKNGLAVEFRPINANSYRSREALEATF